jgi:hypothetical protein
VPLPAGPVLAAQARAVGGNRIEVDLGRAHVVRALEFAVRWRYEEFADRLLVEASEDGREWQQAWLGWTGAAALAAALEDPRVTPLRVPLGDVRARYLRIYPAPPWAARELRVIGQ